MVLGPH